MQRRDDGGTAEGDGEPAYVTEARTLLREGAGVARALAWTTVLCAGLAGALWMATRFDEILIYEAR